MRALLLNFCILASVSVALGPSALLADDDDDWCRIVLSTVGGGGVVMDHSAASWLQSATKPEGASASIWSRLGRFFGIVRDQGKLHPAARLRSSPLHAEKSAEPTTLSYVYIETQNIGVLRNEANLHQSQVNLLLLMIKEQLAAELEQAGISDIREITFDYKQMQFSAELAPEDLLPKLTEALDIVEKRVSEFLRDNYGVDLKAKDRRWIAAGISPRNMNEAHYAARVRFFEADHISAVRIFDPDSNTVKNIASNLAGLRILLKAEILLVMGEDALKALWSDQDVPNLEFFYLVRLAQSESSWRYIFSKRLGLDVTEKFISLSQLYIERLKLLEPPFEYTEFSENSWKENSGASTNSLLLTDLEGVGIRHRELALQANEFAKNITSSTKPADWAVSLKYRASGDRFSNLMREIVEILSGSDGYSRRVDVSGDEIEARSDQSIEEILKESPSGIRWTQIQTREELPKETVQGLRKLSETLQKKIRRSLVLNFGLEVAEAIKTGVRVSTVETHLLQLEVFAVVNPDSPIFSSLSLIGGAELSRLQKSLRNAVPDSYELDSISLRVLP